MMTTYLTGEFRLQIGQPHVISPLAGIDDDEMRAFVIAAIDEKPGRAGLPHFLEGDFLSARGWSEACFIIPPI